MSKIVMASNNRHKIKEIEVFLRKLCPNDKSGKPFAKKTIDKVLSALGAERKSAAFMGDQIFTDVCAGKFNGMRAILVPPIKDKTSLFFKTKRLLEKPVLRHYFKKHNSN